LDSIEVVLSTPDVCGVQRLWRLQFKGVLRFEFEITGDGSSSRPLVPIEIYDVYYSGKKVERQRWVKRLKALGLASHEAKQVRHVVLASSFARGWGTRQGLEGLSIICRQVKVQRAPTKYHRSGFTRPQIQGSH
jgi:hypothetical protein